MFSKLPNFIVGLFTTQPFIYVLLQNARMYVLSTTEVVDTKSLSFTTFLTHKNLNPNFCIFNTEEGINQKFNLT